MAKSINGLELSRMYYQQAVQPILAEHFKDLPYSAGLFGRGSEVLGYDDVISRDHHWGPRLVVLVANQHTRRCRRISKILSENLPVEIGGYSTHFAEPDYSGVRFMQPGIPGQINHMIEVNTVKRYFTGHLGFDPTGKITTKQWAGVLQQRLLEMTSGEVFHDGLRELHAIRRKLAYFPRDVWLCLMANRWQELTDDEAFVGRTGHTGDELGSAVLAARQLDRVMSIAFLQAKKYEPYEKWKGRAFAELEIARRLVPLMREVAKQTDWKDRDRKLAKVYEVIVREHNRLAITKPVSEKAVFFYNRPYRVIYADKIANAIKKRIRGREARQLTHVWLH